MILAALYGQLTVAIATKIACSQTLYFLFKVHRARMMKNKNVLEKNEKKNRTTSVYRLQRKCEAFEFGFGFNNHESFTKATRKLSRKHVLGSSSQSLSFLVPTLISHQCKMAAVLAFTGIRGTQREYSSNHLNIALLNVF